jgi:hypothetical protein
MGTTSINTHRDYWERTSPRHYIFNILFLVQEARVGDGRGLSRGDVTAYNVEHKLPREKPIAVRCLCRQAFGSLCRHHVAPDPMLIFCTFGPVSEFFLFVPFVYLWFV